MSKQEEIQKLLDATKKSKIGNKTEKQIEGIQKTIDNRPKHWHSNVAKSNRRKANDENFRKKLRDTSGRGKTVVTPKGIFDRFYKALEAHGFKDKSTLQRLMKKEPDKYYYLDSKGNKVVFENKTTTKHPNLKPVATPLGIFVSASDALRAHGINTGSRGWLKRRMQLYPQSYYFIDKSAYIWREISKK